MEAEMRDLRTSSKQMVVDSSDNVELDSEGMFEDYTVVKQSFEFDCFIVTV